MNWLSVTFQNGKAKRTSEKMQDNDYDQINIYYIFSQSNK